MTISACIAAGVLFAYFVGNIVAVFILKRENRRGS
jgi:hypothetical protein